VGSIELKAGDGRPFFSPKSDKAHRELGNGVIILRRSDIRLTPVDWPISVN